jgi:glycosyltransferase involved in cell wall biosynthesis
MKLSIITVNYNDAAGLEKTILSVIKQTFRDIEFIIIDGGSTDGSREIINNYNEKISYSVSEKDNGIYDAMNKGIHQAHGEYLLFLNSGDYLYKDDVLNELFLQNPTCDLIYGNQYKIGKGIVRYPPAISLNFFMEDTLPHQATFIRRELFNTVGLYDEKYEIANDYKFFVEALFSYQCSYKYYDITIAYFDQTGLSNQQSYKILNEFKAIRKELFVNFIDDFEILYFKSKRLWLIERSRSYRLIKKVMGLFKPERK